MKKSGIILMLSLTLLFSGFLFGLLYGRNSGRNVVNLPAVDPVIDGQSIITTESEQLGKVNINTATAQELSTLPGIGEVIAQRIIEYRETEGPFQSINDLLNVKGIGNQCLNSISKYITVGG